MNVLTSVIIFCLFKSDSQSIVDLGNKRKIFKANDLKGIWNIFFIMQT